MKLLELKNEQSRLVLKILGKKVLSHKIKTKYDKIYAKRFDGLTNDELRYCIIEQFKRVFGYEPDLSNPKTFNEKLAWEKLYYRNPLMTICADKVNARNYFAEKIENGEKYLVKQFGVYDSVDEIDFSMLPEQFVLKSNWGSGQQFIVTDKSTFDIESAKEKMSVWLNKNSNHYFMTFETGYKDITPKIVCEELLDFEYKLEFFCFNGEPKFFWIVLNDKTNQTQANFYNLDWTQMPLDNHYPNFNEKYEKPVYYDDMLNMAKVLCGDFPFVRCDFYKTKDSFKFSEMTFFHWGGLEKYNPVEYDKIIGDMMSLPNNM